MKFRMKLVTFLSAIAVLALCTSAFAQKGGKKPPPPPPPPTPSDPAIAYITGGIFGGNLMVMNADGSNQTMLLDDRDFNNADPSWSPDGSQLVFVRYGGYERSVCVINKDGSNLRVLADSDVRAFEYPEWSPRPLGDGAYKILYRDSEPADPNQPGNPADLYIMNLDGSGIVNITNTPENEFYPTWDPTGRRIAAEIPRTYPETDIVVYDIAYTDSDGDGVFTFTATPSVNLTEYGPLQDARLTTPSWAKTQNKVVVSAYFPDDPSGWSLWVIDVSDPLNPTQILPPSSANPLMPSWSADDSKIVYRVLAPWTKGKKGQSGIFVMNADGTGATNNGYPSDGNWPEWRRCCPDPGCEVACAE
jgi:Tol biopolymer transport system component